MTTQNNGGGTIVEDGEADEAIGVDVFVDGDVTDEDDLGGLDGLSSGVGTDSVVNLSCSVKFYPS